MTRKHKRTLISLTSILMSLSGGVLYVAHDITHVSVVPDTWSDKWAILVILAGILNKAGQSIINHLTPEKPNARSDSNSIAVRAGSDTNTVAANSPADPTAKPNAGADTITVTASSTTSTEPS